MINVYEFIDLCIDGSMLNVELWDVDKEEQVYSGTLDDMPEEFQTAYVTSYDIPMMEGMLTLNITIED